MTTAETVPMLVPNAELNRLTPALSTAAGGALITTPEPDSDPVLILPAHAVYDGPTDFAEMRQWCEWLAESDTLPAHFRAKPANVAVAALRARSLNIPFYTSLTEIWVTDDGQEAMTAKLANGLMIRAGHRVTVVQSDNQVCRLELRRRDRPGDVLRSEWTISEALAAGLLNLSDVWSNYPKDSLFARALTRLATRYASDVTMGIPCNYEELKAFTLRQRERTIDGDAPQVPDEISGLLGSLDKATTATQVAQLHKLASKKGWLSQVCTADGRTVEDVLFARGDALAIDEEDAADAAQAEQQGQPVERAKCGCDVEALLMGGAHGAGCAWEGMLDGGVAA